MANAARKHDQPAEAAPRASDPLNPAPSFTDPAMDPRFTPANDRDIENVVQPTSASTGVLLAALVIVLAVIAYFLFVPGTPTTPVPADQPATSSEPVAPAPEATAPAPDATAPAAPADQTAPAPDATAPATPTPAEPQSSAPAPVQ